MHHAVLVGDIKDFSSKVVFFLLLLTSVGIMYLESNMFIDIAYFVVVLILFIKFLIVKLYH